MGDAAISVPSSGCFVSESRPSGAFRSASCADTGGMAAAEEIPARQQLHSVQPRPLTPDQPEYTTSARASSPDDSRETDASQPSGPRSVAPAALEHDAQLAAAAAAVPSEHAAAQHGVLGVLGASAVQFGASDAAVGAAAAAAGGADPAAVAPLPPIKPRGAHRRKRPRSTTAASAQGALIELPAQDQARDRPSPAKRQRTGTCAAGPFLPAAHQRPLRHSFGSSHFPAAAAEQHAAGQPSHSGSSSPGYHTDDGHPHWRKPWRRPSGAEGAGAAGEHSGQSQPYHQVGICCLLLLCNCASPLNRCL
jgi:hypothetical protein